VRSTGKCYGLGGTYYLLEEPSAIYRNMLRTGRSILRSGETHYRLEEHTAVWRNTVRSTGKCYGLGGTYYRLEGTLLSGGTLLCAGTR